MHSLAARESKAASVGTSAASRTAQPVSFEEAKEDLHTQLSQQAVSQYVETLRSGAKIERFGPDGKPLEEPKKQ